MPDIRDISTQRAIADAYIENGGNQEKAVIAARIFRPLCQRKRTQIGGK